MELSAEHSHNLVYTGRAHLAWKVSDVVCILVISLSFFFAFLSHSIIFVNATKFWCVVVQEAVSDGEGISYPTSEVAGQLYAYRMSQDLVVLGTRGLVPNSGASVGVKEIASGMYTCVAVNNEANNSQTVVIDVDGEFGMDVVYCK